MNYVDQYLRLDERASAAENKVEEYRTRAEENRWEQSRIAHEAVRDGGYTQAQFSQEVGKSTAEISRQVRVWDRYAQISLATRPAFADAVASVMGMGTTVEAETDRKQISNARAVLRSPEAARELLADPVVRAVASEAIQHHRKAEPVPRPSAPTGDDAFLRCVDDMGRVKQSLMRLVENINEGRKNGYLAPAVLREFADQAQLYLDAIREIAESRGLTDEALYEWIGEEA